MSAFSQFRTRFRANCFERSCENKVSQKLGDFPTVEMAVSFTTRNLPHGIRYVCVCVCVCVCTYMRLVDSGRVALFMRHTVVKV